MLRFIVVCLFLGAAGLALAREQGWHERRMLERAGLAVWTDKIGLTKDETKKAPDSKASTDPKASAGKKGPPPAPVTAASVVMSDMPVILTAPGTVEALASVAVRSRVDGQIVEVGFKEGDLVKQGQVLFKLDDRLVISQIRQAEAAIARDQANLRDAEGTLSRREQLVSKKIVSEAAADTSRASVEALKASVAAGQALLEMQRTQLDYLTIRAPITGRTGSLSAKLGANIRAADPTVLVTINQTQPIGVSFAVPQIEMPTLRRALANRARAMIRFDGAEPGGHEGVMAMVDNQVDRLTGTLTAKVSVPNIGELLWPGQAVDVALTVEVRKDVLSAPASAVLPSQQGMLAWVIGTDNRVAPRPVTVERIVGQVAFISSGLKAGERVVTDGHIRIAPGATVAVQEPRTSDAPPAKKAAPTDVPAARDAPAPVPVPALAPSDPPAPAAPSSTKFEKGKKGAGSSKSSNG